MNDTAFSKLSDDVVLNIFFKLEDEPRSWARMACVCTKFSSLIRNVCWRNKCVETIPCVVDDLLSLSPAASAPPGGWAALHKLAVCCPGLLHSGVLLENSDFGLERELGPEENFPNSAPTPIEPSSIETSLGVAASGSDCSWSLYDDLYFDTVYNASEAQDEAQIGDELETQTHDVKAAQDGSDFDFGFDLSVCKRRKLRGDMRSHLASGVWNLSREQGNKLLASRFRADSLYICDWPGCVHTEEKRNYMLFRGIFKDFKRSRVWRTINDGNRSRVGVKCAFCSCRETWDLHSSFCLRRVFGFHDDGEPVVRAYVCENGHVSGAWTELPLYT